MSAASRPAASTSASYSQPLGGIGSLGFNFVGTWLDELIVDPLGGHRLTIASASTAISAARRTRSGGTRFRVSCTHPDGHRPVGPVALLLGGRQRYARAPIPTLPARRPGRATAGSRLQNYFDLALTARIGDHYSFRLGVNNILDRDPPIAVHAGAVRQRQHLSAGVRRAGSLHLRRRHARLLRAGGLQATGAGLFGGPPFFLGSVEVPDDIITSCRT